jgi:hypothetical protein
VSHITGIDNIVARGTMDPASLDASMSAVVSQLGGSAWAGGSPVVHPGALDGSNFQPNSKLPNAFKKEPYSLVRLNAGLYYTAGSMDVGRHAILGILPMDMHVSWVSVAFGVIPDRDAGWNPDPGPIYGVVRILADASELGMIVLPASGLKPGKVASGALSEARMKAGTVLAADLRGLLGVVSGSWGLHMDHPFWQFGIWGHALHGVG